MSDRTLCDSTFRSKRLARLSERAFGLFPYIFQQTDDKGNLDTDPVLIKCQRLPLIHWATVEVIEEAIQQYNKVGSLFLWNTDGHRYGHFVGFEVHSGRYLSKRRRSDIPEPPPQELAKFLKDNNRFQDSKDFQTAPTVETLPNCSHKLSQVKLNNNKIPAPSAVELSTSVENDKGKVEEFLEKAKNPTSGFGTGRPDNEWRKDVKEVVIALMGRCQNDWGQEITDKKKFINKFFGLTQNLMIYGLPRKPRVPHARGSFTPKEKMIKLINRMSRPRDLVAEFIDAVRKQPAYLP